MVFFKKRKQKPSVLFPRPFQRGGLYRRGSGANPSSDDGTKLKKKRGKGGAKELLPSSVKYLDSFLVVHLYPSNDEDDGDQFTSFWPSVLSASLLHCFPHFAHLPGQFKHAHVSLADSLGERASTGIQG